MFLINIGFVFTLHSFSWSLSSCALFAWNMLRVKIKLRKHFSSLKLPTETLKLFRSVIVGHLGAFFMPPIWGKGVSTFWNGDVLLIANSGRVLVLQLTGLYHLHNLCYGIPPPFHLGSRSEIITGGVLLEGWLTLDSWGCKSISVFSFHSKICLSLAQTLNQPNPSMLRCALHWSKSKLLWISCSMLSERTVLWHFPSPSSWLRVGALPAAALEPVVASW